MLVLADAPARAQTDCGAAPPASADQVDELLLLVDSGPGSETALLSVLHGWGEHFWVDEATLGGWRIPVAALPARKFAGHPWHALEDVPKLTYRFDACRQQLHVDLTHVPRIPITYALSTAPEGRVPPASPGAFLNYDLQYTRDHSSDDLAALTELGVFGPAGRGLQTLLLGDGRHVRLDSTWFWESPEHLSTIALGDNISYGGSWGRSLRFGGLRWATDFSLQPYIVTFPRPSLRGEAALPSTLDVFVNDTLGARQQVEGGAFELQDVPTLTGAGEAQIVMRDPLGRETRVTQPFYVSPALLRPGLRDFSLDAGFQRERYAQESNDYGAFFTDFTERRGITDQWTQEFRAETQSHGAAAGTSALWLPRRIGLFSATAVWGGRVNSGGGVLGGVGFERDAAGFYSMAVRSQWTSAGFWQLGLEEGHRAPRRTDLARFSIVPHPGASLALAYADEDRRDEADLRLITLAYSVQIRPQLQFLLSAIEATADRRQRTVIAALSYRFSDHIDAAGQYEWHDAMADTRRVSVQRSPHSPLDWGYRAEVQDGPMSRQELRGDWGLPAAQLSANAVHDDSGSSARLNASGGIVFLDRKGYLTRPVQGSFAVVKVADVADVNIYADQRLVARTGPNGTALVPDLRPYQRNTLTVHAEDVPVELPLDSMKQVVTPRGRSGVVVDFGGETRIGQEFVLRNGLGRPVPAGAVVRDIGMGGDFPVGAAGHVFVTLPAGTHHLWVNAEGWDCIAQVQVQRRAADAAADVVTCKSQPQ